MIGPPRRRLGDWIQTYATGTEFYPLDPRPSEIHIADIAHALANVNRFTGHTRFAYSVGQHSVLVSRHVSPENALWALLHDAAEAYILDLARPLKRLPEFAAFREVEARVMAAVCERFGLPPEEPEEVAFADKAMLWAEANALLARKGRPLNAAWEKWREYETPPVGLIARITPWSPTAARTKFLARFDELGGYESIRGKVA